MGSILPSSRDLVTKSCLVLCFTKFPLPLSRVCFSIQGHFLCDVYSYNLRGISFSISPGLFSNSCFPHLDILAFVSAASSLGLNASSHPTIVLCRSFLFYFILFLIFVGRWYSLDLTPGRSEQSLLRQATRNEEFPGKVSPKTGCDFNPAGS